VDDIEHVREERRLARLEVQRLTGQLAELSKTRDELQALVDRQAAELEEVHRAPVRRAAPKLPAPEEEAPPAPSERRAREAALIQARVRAELESVAAEPEQVEAEPVGRLRRGEAQAPLLPAQGWIGLVLLVVGLALAVLILTGAIRLGFAP
jgi:hypothetical protein